jgi:hypothetical protein
VSVGDVQVQRSPAYKHFADVQVDAARRRIGATQLVYVLKMVHRFSTSSARCTPRLQMGSRRTARPSAARFSLTFGTGAQMRLSSSAQVRPGQ